MNYKEWLEEITKYGSVLGLDGIKRLLELLGDPQKDLKVVHCAGTNGKGSTLAFVQSVLMCAGYRVGRYSSPAVFDRWEIIRVNDEYIDEASVITICDEIQTACKKMIEEGMAHPTIFEVETAMAFLYFKRMNCDIALIECGMGGKEDATNVFKRVLCSVITPISLDHTVFLGDTIEKIANVKGGIIKEGCPVVVANQSVEAIRILEKKAKGRVVLAGNPTNVTIIRNTTGFEYKDKEWEITLKGSHQIVNAATAIEVIDILIGKGFDLADFVKEGLKKAKWQGRLEVVSENPFIVIDGAHNPDAVQRLLESIDLYFTNKRITFIMGVLADKNFEEEAKIIANRAENIVTVTPNNSRGLDSKVLMNTLLKYKNDVVAADSCGEAIKIAKEFVQNKESDMILAFGSLSYLKEFTEALK